MPNIDPFEYLQGLEKRTLKVASKLPTVDQMAGEWVGLAFSIGSTQLLSSMSEVKEVLEMPEFTMIPGVKSWVIGIANVRGSLLPLLDLKGYLLDENKKNRESGKVIVVSYKGFNTGLVVDEVFGMRHFREGETLIEKPMLDKRIMPFITEAYKSDNEQWSVLSISEMTKNERFDQVSL